jgi:anthranilate synthase component 2
MGLRFKKFEYSCTWHSNAYYIIETDTIFQNCPKTFNVGRYHSWVINPYTLPSELIITAKDLTENIMAIKHKTHDVRAVQFHPESILSEYGETILKNWIES